MSVYLILFEYMLSKAKCTLIVEEFEDKEGNAYDKATFNLLVKQGIV